MTDDYQTSFSAHINAYATNAAISAPPKKVVQKPTLQAILQSADFFQNQHNQTVEPLLLVDIDTNDIYFFSYDGNHQDYLLRVQEFIQGRMKNNDLGLDSHTDEQSFQDMLESTNLGIWYFVPEDQLDELSDHLVIYQGEFDPLQTSTSEIGNTINIDLEKHADYIMSHPEIAYTLPVAMLQFLTQYGNYSQSSSSRKISPSEELNDDGINLLLGQAYIELLRVVYGSNFTQEEIYDIYAIQDATKSGIFDLDILYESLHNPDIFSDYLSSGKKTRKITIRDLETEIEISEKLAVEDITDVDNDDKIKLELNKINDTARNLEEVNLTEEEVEEALDYMIENGDSFGMFILNAKMSGANRALGLVEGRLNSIYYQRQQQLIKRIIEEDAQDYLKHSQNYESLAAFAGDHLLISNTFLTISLAKKRFGQGVPFLDLIQEGFIGMLRARDKFDYRRGYKFTTYAHWWAKQSIGRAVADQGKTIRIPVHKGEQIRRYHKLINEMKQGLNRDPTSQELSIYYMIRRRDDIAIGKSFSPEIAHAAIEASNNPQTLTNYKFADDEWKHAMGIVDTYTTISLRPLSLEAPLEDDDASTIEDFIEDVNTPEPEPSSFHSVLGDDLFEALESLPPREARVLRLRFGIDDGQAYTLEEVGRKMGVTRERIRQIEATALNRLRIPTLNNRKLRDHLG